MPEQRAPLPSPGHGMGRFGAAKVHKGKSMMASMEDLYIWLMQVSNGRAGREGTRPHGTPGHWLKWRSATVMECRVCLHAADSAVPSIRPVFRGGACNSAETAASGARSSPEKQPPADSFSAQETARAGVMDGSHHHTALAASSARLFHLGCVSQSMAVSNHCCSRNSPCFPASSSPLVSYLVLTDVTLTSSQEGAVFDS